MILEEIKKDFPLLENRDIAYLDSGATTQKPKQVIEAIEKYYFFSMFCVYKFCYFRSCIFILFCCFYT